MLRAYLMDVRDSARAILARGSHLPESEPGQLHPKSAAWRQLVALAAPLTPYERADIEDELAVAEDWLSKLDTADEQTLALLSQAVIFERARGRAHTALLFNRGAAADRQDARKQRSRDVRQDAGRLKGAAASRKVERQLVEHAVQRAQREHPQASWTRVCEIAARRVKLSGHYVRHLLADSPLRIRRAG